MNDTTRIPNSPARKPRLALMGEFSAGKSTLSNLLLGADPLPVRVTATRLPPVWISYGEDAATREDLDGNIIPIDINQLESVQLEATRLIRLSLKSDLLQLCDLIDMPGISDPNMDSDVWRAVIGEADNIIWCSHATQAWRQSEAAVWDSLPGHIREKSLLLLTRFDKILSPRDRDRVMTRVRRETEGLFYDLFPISLTEALSAGEDREAWESSGAEPFVKCLVDLLMNRAAPLDAAPLRETQALRKTQDEGPQARVTEPDPAEAEQASTIRIMPARVRAKSGGQRRPRRAPSNAMGEQVLVEMPGNV